MLRNIEWRKPFLSIVERTEEDFGIVVCINEAVLLNAVRRAEETLGNLGIARPNVAKIAGCLVFWLRKLKPLSLAAVSPNYFDQLNEHAAIHLGIAICETHLDDLSNGGDIRLPKRILEDWIASLRYHSHSPHSLMTAFEILACIE